MMALSKVIHKFKTAVALIIRRFKPDYISPIVLLVLAPTVVNTAVSHTDVLVQVPKGVLLDPGVGQ